MGMPVPKQGEFHREKGLCLRFHFSPPIPSFREDASVGIRLFIERALPVKSLLALWTQRRDDVENLIQTTKSKVCFGDTLREHAEPCALDGYHLAKSRKHRIDFAIELPQISEASSVSTPVVALAKIYHAVQGLVRGDATRLTILHRPRSN